MIATHLGIVDEQAIDNMSLSFFESVLEELGRKLNYEAVVNYVGNSFAKDAWKMVESSYPMAPGKKKGGDGVVAAFLGG